MFSVVFKFSIIGIFTFLIIHYPMPLQAQDEAKENEYHHCLVEQNSFSFGLGVPYSFEVKTAGLNFRLYHNTGESLCFGPEFSFFKKDEVLIWDVDMIVHYIIETPWVGVYPVAGINYTKEIEENNTYEDAFGLLWGAGVHRNLKNITLFIEYTRVESQLRDQFITGGLMYRFKIN